jgi:diguanylate cyclase (GGDEF)-like protein
MRDGDYVARFGGDEFVILVERLAATSDVEQITDRIHAVLAHPVSLPGEQFTLSVSIGTAVASPDHNSPEDVLAAADRAMYATKRSGG